LPSSYQKEREVLDEFVEEIYEKNKEQFDSEEDVFKIFTQATIGGQLLPLARIWEKTYGKGSFRDLGKVTKFRGLPEMDL